MAMDTLIRETPARRALRRCRQSMPTHAALLTLVTHGRRPVFVDHEIAAATCRVIAQPGLWRGANVLCWVLMPDHWHGIVELGHYEPIAELMRRFKTATATEVNRDRRAHGAVWASGWQEHALRYEEDLVGVARYVVANPVRAELVQRIGDWPYWDAAWL